MNNDSLILGPQLDAAYIKALAKSLQPKRYEPPTRKLASGIVYQDSFQSGSSEGSSGGPSGPGTQVWITEQRTLADNATTNWDICPTADAKAVVIHYEASRDAGVAESGSIKAAHENGSADFQWQQDILFGGGVGISSIAASIASSNLRLAFTIDNSVTTDVTLRVLYALIEV